MRRVALIGAGYIAQVHAEALRTLPGVRIVAVADPNLDAARRLADAFGADRAHASAREALEAGGLDAAHVLVPPNLHRDVALPLLQAGVPVLLEKPMAVSGAECEALLAAAEGAGVALGVNQNFAFHPAFLRLRRIVEEGRLGRPGFVDLIYSVPLRQLAVRQFGHWMFHEPGNILLEQAVHPLSQIAALAGPVRELRAIADPPIEIAPGLPFFPATTVALGCDRLPAQLRFAVGQPFPLWRISVVCDDGVAVADILTNRVVTEGRTRYLEAMDNLATGARGAGAALGEAVRNGLDYGLSTLRLKARTEPFFVSMRNSIAAFHDALGGGRPYETDGAFGARLVAACERIADAAGFAPTPRRAAAASAASAGPAPAAAGGPAPDAAAPPPSPDVAVLGGTGFIGAETVRRLVAQGRRVAVMARSVRNLPPVFSDPRVTLHRGDLRDPEAVGRAVAGARAVVNLAHGGGGATFEAVRQAMVGGAETVGRACLAAGVRRLVHVGSIASLYLGPDAGTVTGATPSDPRAEERGDYTRAKALADSALLETHAREGLPVVVLRPGLVVGEGTAPLHSGLGFFNNDQHVIGWNAGRNPLPFVLVSDVADAILLACDAPKAVEGRAYNLVGDVRPSAREFVADLARATGRPLRFHPQRADGLWVAELGKWLVKRAGGRSTPLPSRRDLLSRGLMATFDCSDAKRDLGWRPVADPAEFARQAIAVHAPRARRPAPHAPVEGGLALAP